MSDYKTDYTEEALDRLLTTLKGGTKLEALVAAYTDRVQEFEDGSYRMLGSLDIETATGVELDRIGTILNVARGGRDDETYRLRLKLEIAILNSDGTALDLITVLGLFLGATQPYDIELDESFPKCVFLRARDTADSLALSEMTAAELLLQRAVSAGTSLEVIFNGVESLDANVFHFSETADTTESSATYGTESGRLAQTGIND